MRPVQLCPGETWAELRVRTDVWVPLAEEVLDRHAFRLDSSPFLGLGGTYPAIISGELVVKFFGFTGEWQATWSNERVAQELLALDARIRGPQLLGAGHLFPEEDEPLPYLILSRIPGRSWCDVQLGLDERLSIAEELGQQLALVHALPHEGLPTIDTWQFDTPGERAKSGAFPSHLVHDVDDWLETVPAAQSAFVHSDIFVRHPFVQEGHLTGIIDWGDAMAADPHVEFGKLHLDVFEGDKRLPSTFLDAYAWPVDAEFSRRALAMALCRHAQIHGQHGPCGDVFFRIPELTAGKQIRDLDDLAETLFGN